MSHDAPDDAAAGSWREPRTQYGRAPDGRLPLTTCFGGGGAFGIGFNLGVARALHAGGIPLTAHPMLGSSAGAWTAAALVVGADLEDIQASWSRRSPGKVRVIEL